MELHQECRERIRAFLAQYLQTKGGGILPADTEFLKDGVKVLMKNDIFGSKEEMKKECLEDYNVVIPDCMFMEG